ncbi:unnamed protein product [Brachionus calyciflorus]|uniref:Uncharacterized protein n=1 Tax=Brachionus calyciflorus TaxID=104777 RepID=A0A814B8P7_9BILA|nr:unnamed protein product [Brachionus calyciflorus]
MDFLNNSSVSLFFKCSLVYDYPNLVENYEYNFIYCLVNETNNFQNFILLHAKIKDFSPDAKLYYLEIMNLNTTELKIVSNLENLYSKVPRLNSLFHKNQSRYYVNNKIREIPFKQNVLLNNLVSLKNKPNKINDKNINFLNLTQNINPLISFPITTSMKKLNLSYNSIRNIKTKRFNGLNSLDLSHNYIENIEFSTPNYNLLELSLNFNKIKLINRNFFSGLSELRNLYLDGNEIYYIQSKSFAQNNFLAILSLKFNKLSMIPDISSLKNLRYLFLGYQNSSLIRIQNNAFERELQNSHETFLDVYLNGNFNLEFEKRAFCSQYSNDLKISNTKFYFEAMNPKSKCILQQLGGKNIFLNLSNNSNFIEGKCQEKNDERNDCELQKRYSTWIGYNFEVNSYKNKIQNCHFDKTLICLKIKNLIFYCTQDTLIDSKKTIKVISNIQIGDAPLNISVSSLFNFESNGKKKKVILNDQNYGFEIFRINDFLVNINFLKLKANLLIFKYYSFYGLKLKADHKFYSRAKGLLVEGCFNY